MLHFLFAAIESNEPVLERLDPQRRVAVAMALVALTLVGLFLVAFAMIGGHWVRRLAQHRPGTRRIVASPADHRQIRDSLKDIVPEAKTDDTVLLNRRSEDTTVDT